ncbi:MAG: hypothetical protein E7487_06265 [Ruminococcaceae bacterium]|nr:hypothetical protein [Oscillospiraceae bacterium]
MTYTFESLAQAIGCPALPDLLFPYFSQAMEEYDKNGCLLADPALFENLHKQYGCYPNHLDIFCDAARQIAADEPLARYLTLLGIAIRDRDAINQSPYAIPMLTPPEGKPALGYEMVNGLSFAAVIPDAYNTMMARGIPEELVRSTLANIEGSVREFAIRNGGRPGYHLFGWFQLIVDGKLFRIHRLEIEIGNKFEGHGSVFRSSSGEEVHLADGIKIHKSGYAFGSPNLTDEEGAWEAHIVETEDYFEGHPVSVDGRTSVETVRLSRSEWKKILSHGDPTVHLHIPGNGVPFTPENVDETIRETKEFLASYFPDFRYKAFTCSSWMLDPQLWDMLGDSSNLVHFGKRFHMSPAKSGGKGVFYFVFKQPTPAELSNEYFSSLPGETRLHRLLKQHYLDGKYIYEVTGYFFA